MATSPETKRGQAGKIIASREGTRYQRMNNLTLASIRVTFTIALKDLQNKLYHVSTSQLDSKSLSQLSAYKGFQRSLPKLRKSKRYHPSGPGLQRTTAHKL